MYIPLNSGSVAIKVSQLTIWIIPYGHHSHESYMGQSYAEDEDLLQTLLASRSIGFLLADQNSGGILLSHLYFCFR